MATPIDPARLDPRARADRALEVAKAGFDAESPAEIAQDIQKAFYLVKDGKLDFGSPGRTWEFFRDAVDVVVRKEREAEMFTTKIRTLGQRAPLRPASLAEIFHLPTGAFKGVSPMDVGRIAAVVVEFYAPDLYEIVPVAFRSKEEPLAVQAEFPEETLRRIVREELQAARPPSVIEFRPEGGVHLTRGTAVFPEPEAPEAPEEPAPTPKEVDEAVATPPALPLPKNPSFPSPEQIRTYGRSELTNLFATWAALFKQQNVRPPPLSYDAARRRFEQVLKFPAPEIFPPAPPPVGGLTLERGPTPTPTAPAAEAAPGVAVPAEFYAAEATQLLTEKYRPRTLGDVLGNPNILNRLKLKVRSSAQLPAMMVFTGPPGLGKTTVAQALARDYFKFKFAQRQAEFLLGPNGFPEGGYFEVSAAKVKDDPTGFITTKVLPFLRAAGFFGGSIKRFLVFDDVANLSAENQKLLLRPLEQFGKGVTVVWISNDPMKHLPAIESRAAGETYRFSPLSRDDTEKGLRHVAEGEGWTFPSDKVFSDVAVAAQGDLRAGIGFLNARWEEVQGERS